MTANRMGHPWPQQDQLRLSKPTTNTYGEMLRAQARIEEWLTAQGLFSREAVREMMMMVVEPGRVA